MSTFSEQKCTIKLCECTTLVKNNKLFYFLVAHNINRAVGSNNNTVITNTAKKLSA